VAAAAAALNGDVLADDGSSTASGAAPTSRCNGYRLQNNIY